jgi:hypothetical protein
MVQTLTDMLNDQPTTKAKALIWVRLCGDLQRSVIRQNIITIGDTIMHKNMKIVSFVGWVAVALIGSQLFRVLRHIGMEWTDWPGFLRVITLLLFVVMFVFVPAVLSLLAWFGWPNALYKRFTTR